MAEQQTEPRQVKVKGSEESTRRAVQGGTAVHAPAQSETEKGQRFFLDEVQKLGGVFQVETYGGETLAEQWIRVHVQRGDLDTEYAVYDLKGEAYRRHPEACLQVEVWLEDPPVDPVKTTIDAAPEAPGS